jgi:hypothetical protein
MTGAGVAQHIYESAGSPCLPTLQGMARGIAYNFAYGAEQAGSHSDNNPKPGTAREPIFYVSGQNGNDAWSGLLPAPNAAGADGPFRTLSAVQAAMRASSTVKTVAIRSGTYSIAPALSLSRADSGEVWMSYPGETATLDGGGTGGIDLAGVSNAKLLGLALQNLGRKGVNIFGGSSAITIRWNAFANCTWACISGAGVTNTTVYRNVINNQIDTTGAALMFWSGRTLAASQNRISHNTIENCRGGGINFAAGANDLPNNNNVVDRNILRNITTEVTDHGAIYMMDRTHRAVGNEITNNLIDGNGGTRYRSNWTKAIYLDDLISNVMVSGNVCRKCGQYALQIHGGDHNTIVNNVFDISTDGTLLGLYQNANGWPDFGMAANIIERNIVYCASRAPASLWKLDVLSTDALPTIAGNLYYTPGSVGRIAAKGRLIDANPFYADPGFRDPSSVDYSMPVSSPAYSVIRFQPLVTDRGPLEYTP